MNTKSIALLLSLVSLQLGCGGGGSSDKPAASTGSSSKALSSASTSSSSSGAISEAEIAKFAPVTGLYKATQGDNEAYLYITPNGTLTAYNYMADSVDLGGNCYRVAIGSDINIMLNGKTLTATDSTFEVTLGAATAGWTLDETKKLSKAFYKNGGSNLSSANLSIPIDGKYLVISINKITVPTITDITSSICK